MSLGASKYNTVSYGCIEWANNQRTLAYHRWACENNLYPANCVPELLNLCHCDADDPETPYVDPITDNVCWNDNSVPESSQFLGAIVLGISGIDNSTTSREVSDGFIEGSVLSRLRNRGKSFGFNILLLATTCEGMSYGEEWLRSVLEDEKCRSERDCTACTGRELSLRKHCPQEFSLDDGLRSWLNAGIVDGLTPIEGQNARTCCCVIKNYTFTMQSASPYSFSCGEEICEVEATTDEEEAFIRCYDFMNDCIDCDDDSCCDKCGFDAGCTCFTPVIVEPLVEDDDCFCEPVAKIIQSCCIEDIPSTYETTFKFDLYSGTDYTNEDYQRFGMRNVTLKLYDNPKNYDCITDQETYDAWCVRAQPCASMKINYVPENSTLSIDGRTGKVTVNCKGKCRPYDHVVTSETGNVFPLVAKCHPLMLVVEWDYYNTQTLDNGTTIRPANMKTTRYLRFRN